MPKVKLWLARGIVGAFFAMLVYILTWSIALYVGWVETLVILVAAVVVVGALMWATTTIDKGR